MAEKAKYRHYCTKCNEPDHCWEWCCPKNPLTQPPTKPCNFCKQSGHHEKCCYKFIAMLNKKDKTKNKGHKQYSRAYSDDSDTPVGETLDHIHFHKKQAINA